MSDLFNNAPELLRHPVCLAMTRIFEHLPEAYFFVKDANSRFLHGNRALLNRLGLKQVSEFAGTTDFDRYPDPVAEQLVAGDRAIMINKEPMIDHPEVLYDHNGKLEWHTSSKYPILDENSSPLGVVGITRPFASWESPRTAHHAAGRAIEFISDNPTIPLRVAELAREFGISERQLHRQFIDYVKISPRDFILRTRINAAAVELRKGSEPIASLAEKYRFCDQSAFTRQFRRILGTTPARYRECPRTGPPAS